MTSYFLSPNLSTVRSTPKQDGRPRDSSRTAGIQRYLAPNSRDKPCTPHVRSVQPLADGVFHVTCCATHGRSDTSRRTVTSVQAPFNSVVININHLEVIAATVELAFDDIASALVCREDSTVPCATSRLCSRWLRSAISEIASAVLKQCRSIQDTIIAADYKIVC